MSLSQFIKRIRKSGKELRLLLRMLKHYRVFVMRIDRNERKSRVRIAAELWLWFVCHRDALNTYFTSNMHLKGRRLREAVPYRQFRRRRDRLNAKSRVHDAPPCNANLRDKHLFYLVLHGAGIPTPEVVAVLTQRHVFWEGSGRIEPLDILWSADTFELDGFLKPACGKAGKGAHALMLRAGEVQLDGQTVSCDELAARIGPDRRFVLQHRVAQHPEMARPHPASLNTARFVTLAHGLDSIRTVFFGVRFGVNGIPADNRDGGGLIVELDPASGRLVGDAVRCSSYLLKAARAGQEIRTRYTHHPDTGVAFDDIVVPYFDEAQELVQRAHRTLAGVFSIGWDVAFTPKGPVLLEGNDTWGGEAPMDLIPDFRSWYLQHFGQHVLKRL